MGITILGGQTKTIFLKGIENHKLHQEFEVDADKTVKKGQPVKLTASGTIVAAAVDELTVNIIGWAIHNGEDGELVTVGMRAMAIIWASPNGAVDAGPVAYDGLNTADSSFNAFKAIGNDTATPPIPKLAHAGWQLDKATVKDVMVRVAII